ncbi:nuclear GTP-binding protein nug1 [Tilletia horrida]|uniref:Nuclear GTP-binding protein nug1 n=1 Tax=Tilletia horrida TaxID=155126 RepID=A0AAN6JQA7_9BASI|nr:nuclear GTP-binding protein nug1 [Tilletia horrida]
MNGARASIPTSAADEELSSFLSAAAPKQQHDASLKAYFRELKKVISLSDVLLQVLDARDPLGSRSLTTERLIMSQGKRVVLILNKVDLAPQDNVLAWLKYLRHDFPTLAFKSSTQSQRSNLSQKTSGSASNTALAPHQQTQGALGAQALLSLLKNYSRSLNLKTSLTVGIFGAPNVGKSSLINSLKRARVCSVASTPGHTKVMQGVMLDKHVRLLDCPGIVFADAGEGEHESYVQLRNVIKVESVPDPVVPVQAILSRVPRHSIQKLYNIDVKSADRSLADTLMLDQTQPTPAPDVQDFLLRLALQRGRLGRGGIPDTDATARSVLHDWNTGKIPFYSIPPKLHRSAILSKDRRPGQPQQNGAGGDAMEVTPTNAIEAMAAAATSTGGPSDNVADAPVPTAQSNLEESAAILSSFSEAFDLAGLLGEADAELLGIGNAAAGPTTAASSAPDSAPTLSKGKAKAQSVKDADTTSSGKANGKALGKRRRGGGDSGDLADDEQTDEPAWKSRQRQRAMAPRNGTMGTADVGDGQNHALSRAALKQAKKRAKRQHQIESRSGMGGPGGLLDQLELAMSLDTDEAVEDDIQKNAKTASSAMDQDSKAPAQKYQAPPKAHNLSMFGALEVEDETELADATDADASISVDVPKPESSARQEEADEEW